MDIETIKTILVKMYPSATECLNFTDISFEQSYNLAQSNGKIFCLVRDLNKFINYNS